MDKVTMENVDRSDLLDKFGATLIACIRDYSLKFMRRKLSGELSFSEFAGLIESLSDEQKNQLLKFAAYVVDGCLHDFMLMIENKEWMELHLFDANGDKVSIRDLDVDLQGYAFKWVEQFSKEIRSSLTE